jgi:hypothetical protein
MAKCVRNKKTGEIKRVGNFEAEILVDQGTHEYARKREYEHYLNKIYTEGSLNVHSSDQTS